MKTILSIVIFCQISFFSFAQPWVNVVGFPNDTLSGNVYAFHIYENKLCIGGNISFWPTNTGINNVASWNDTLFSSMDSGVCCGYANALAEFNGQLYAGGDFHYLNSSWRHIVIWNGNNWDSLATQTNGVVTAMCVYQGKLYVGGRFTVAGGIPCNRIATWDGVQWDSVGAGVTGYGNSEVLSFHIYNNELYVGGWFTRAGQDTLATNIAKWNGSTWSNVGGKGADAHVRAITTYNNDLIIAGSFDSVGTSALKYIAGWNGTNWYSFNSTFYGNGIWAMTVYNNELCVGGVFTAPGSNVAKWDGTSWSQIGNGIPTVGSTLVMALQVFNGHLYAGGQFALNGNLARGLAKWNSVTGISENASLWNPVQLFPNPFNFQTTIKLNSCLHNATLTVRNCFGQVMKEMNNISGQTVNFIRDNLPGGLYFIYFTQHNQVIESGKIIIAE